ncbi:hypothetical protein PMZ80_002888 [Knufia obscura]|uniref:DUF8004 domain-containing protein n=1 Tax=Knufia obscura TaxID=1635080 RepID=A0ABR0RYL9_9EURO|nr:hypothetical protein PMZ80_002888 [Knufia obscura]
MSKRLSSLFGHKKEKSEEGALGSPAYSRQDSVRVSPGASPVAGPGKLQKQRLTSTSELSLNTQDIPPLFPPPTFRETASGISNRPSSRPVSRAGTNEYAPPSRDSSRSRPQTPNLLTIPGQAASPAPHSPASPGPGNGARLAKKKSLLPGGKSDKHKFEDGESQQKAWIAGLKEHIPYDLAALLSGGRVSELWDPNGDVVVYLYPEASGRGPSFRVHSALFADSKGLNHLCVPTIDSSLQNMHLGGADNFGGPLGDATLGHNRDPSIPSIMPPTTQPKAVYLPLELDGDYSAPETTPHGDDLELVVLYRNFFAFLGGGALISTPRQVSLFSIFMGIASILRRLAYSNSDGATWGEVPDASFARYCDELRLADVRTSREKTIEAIVLGENMRYWPLYNEGFVHAAGRLEDVKSIKSPKFAKISPITVNRLERAALDVETRLALLHTRLDDFDFPSIFSGIANSQTATEAKLVRFKAWRLAFIDMRKFVLGIYKKRYGAWPPKAKSKKNNFAESGLNRLLVREVYADMCNLYDMLVNPREMTTRSVDLQPMVEEKGTNETIQHALRSMESEFDRSTPPVIPPIPFDTPLIPSRDQSFKGGDTFALTTGASKLKPNEINELLLGSYNREYIKPSSFVQDFMAYERRLNAGATLDQIVDNRCGQWLFIYVVLQSLPMTAMDARGINFTEGCEFFLFSSPRGGKPWMREDTLTNKAWYNVKSAGQTISLSADMLDHQPEGVYRRSHCWVMANEWLAAAGMLPEASLTYSNDSYQGQFSTQASPLEQGASSPQHLTPAQSPLMRPMTPTGPGGSIQSPLAKSSSYSNLQVNLEQVAAPQKAPRPASQYNPGITFDSILGAAAQKPEKKKKK